MKSILFEKLTGGINENFTTKILWYLLRESQPIRGAFLRLLGSKLDSLGKWNVRTQIQVFKNDVCNGFVDLVLSQPGKSLIYVENKPWNGSVPTGSSGAEGDQINRYKMDLAKRTDQEKILCLLCNKNNKNGILQTTAGVLNCDSAELAQKFEQDNLLFVVVTWNDLFAEIKKSSEEIAPFHLGLVHELENYILREPFDSASNDFYSIVKQAHLEFQNDPTRYDQYHIDIEYNRGRGIGYQAAPIGAFQWGYMPYYLELIETADEQRQNPFFFQICIMNPDHREWREYKMNDELLARHRTPLFRRSDPTTQTFLIDDLGFSYLSKGSGDYYFKQLKISPEDVNNPQKIADAAFDILIELQDKIREHFKF